MIVINRNPAPSTGLVLSAYDWNPALKVEIGGSQIQGQPELLVKSLSLKTKSSLACSLVVGHVQGPGYNPQHCVCLGGQGREADYVFHPNKTFLQKPLS